MSTCPDINLYYTTRITCCMDVIALGYTCINHVTGSQTHSKNSSSTTNRGYNKFYFFDPSVITEHCQGYLAIGAMI